MSGMSQLAISSMIFGGVVMVSLLVTGRFSIERRKSKMDITTVESSSILSRVKHMIESSYAQGHGSLALIFLIGVIFGGIIQYTGVNKFEKIAGFAMLKDTIVPKMLFLAVGLTSIGLYFMMEAGIAHYHIKPITLLGLIVGGIIFGISMLYLENAQGLAQYLWQR